ncbi:hypothetical protein ACJMK2_016377 [Sinanodonta woodiana]|uniref:Uncharacterized protein n=1 Tax=Sinanodonta woodiana TaxID=1069815 RepID=A0ABD3UWW7_SINWO
MNKLKLLESWRHLKTNIVGFLLNTLTSIFSELFYGFIMSHIPEDQSQNENENNGTDDYLDLSNVADTYSEFLRIHIDPQMSDSVKQILDSEPCMASDSTSVQNGIILRPQEKSSVTAT